jgi:HipA-like protein
MRFAKVLYKGKQAGILEQNNDGSFMFKYNEEWLQDNTKPPISLTLPKAQKEFSSKELFPFFYHLLPEGVNKKMICRTYKIDESDAFGILLTTAKTDTIGTITIERI